MAQTASTTAQGVTFTAAQGVIAAKVETAESLLYQWACGIATAKDVRTGLHGMGIHLMERLNPHGGGRIDATVDGFGPITLTF